MLKIFAHLKVKLATFDCSARARNDAAGKTGEGVGGAAGMEKIDVERDCEQRMRNEFI